jgi:hypothetical protein
MGGMVMAEKETGERGREFGGVANWKGGKVLKLIFC